MMNRADIAIDIEFLQEELRRCILTKRERAWNTRRISELKGQLDELARIEEEAAAGQ